MYLVLHLAAEGILSMIYKQRVRNPKKAVIEHLNTFLG